MIKNNLVKVIFIFIACFFLNNDYAIASNRAYLLNIRYLQTEITGKVFDKLTNKPLQDVNIYIKKEGIGTISDMNGGYKFSLKKGRYEIVFSHIGYQIENRVIDVRTDEHNIEINVFLQPQMVKGEEISISVAPEEPKIIKYEIPREKLLTIVNPLPDPLLSLKTMPGVFSANDQSTFYNVRGGNYDENLIYLNGVEIYQPLLVRKGIAENPSLVNPDLIRSINLRTGAFPVYYGDKLSSVLDVSYESGDVTKISGTVGVSRVSMKAAIGGLIYKNSAAVGKLTWKLGMRKINYGYLFKRLSTTQGNFSPDFKDIQLLMDWVPDTDNKINFFALLAKSRFEVMPEAWGVDWDFGAKKEIYRLYLNGREKYQYQTGAVALNWTHVHSDRFETYISFSKFEQQEKEDTFVKYFFSKTLRDSIRNQPLPDEKGFVDANKTEDVKNRLSVSLNRLHIDNRFELNPLHQVRFGIELKTYRFDDHLYWKIDEKTLPAEIVSGSDIITSSGFSSYGEYLWQPYLWFSVTAGLRFTEFNFNKEMLIMPRLNLLFKLSESIQLNIASGCYSQPPLYKEFRTRGFRRPSDLRAQKSTQFTIGFESRWQNDLSLRLETFYKSLRDVISYEIWDVRTIYSGRNDAVGYIYGFDAHLRSNIVPDALSWFSYSYMVAREDILSDHQSWIQMPTDIRHTFSATIQDKMERFPGSRFHMRFLLGSGYHYTDYNYQFREDGSIKILSGKRNARKLPYYRRFDVGFTQNFKLKNWDINLREEVLNAFNRKNIMGYSWIQGIKIAHELSRRIFNFGVDVKF